MKRKGTFNSIVESSWKTRLLSIQITYQSDKPPSNHVRIRSASRPSTGTHPTPHQLIHSCTFVHAILQRLAVSRENGEGKSRKDSIQLLRRRFGDNCCSRVIFFSTPPGRADVRNPTLVDCRDRVVKFK
jgi:hypothetical protein